MGGGERLHPESIPLPKAGGGGRDAPALAGMEVGQQLRPGESGAGIAPREENGDAEAAGREGGVGEGGSQHKAPLCSTPTVPPAAPGIVPIAPQHPRDGPATHGPGHPGRGGGTTRPAMMDMGAMTPKNPSILKDGAANGAGTWKMMRRKVSWGIQGPGVVGAPGSCLVLGLGGRRWVAGGQG